MKKVLIITNLYHASPRIPGLCEYLPEFGWEPVVLVTPFAPDKDEAGPPRDFRDKVKTIEVPYRGLILIIRNFLGFKSSEGSRSQLEKKFGKKSWFSQLVRKLLILGASVLAYPDEMRSWRAPTIRAGKKIIFEEKIDALLSSSSPVTSHRVAQALQKSSKLPWLADFRDLWTQNHNYPYPELRRVIERRLELRTIASAGALSTVSESTADKLRSRYAPKNVYVIPNGFDPKNINEPPQPLTPQFTITYTGSIYHGKQDPQKLFEALGELCAENVLERARVLVRFYGTRQTFVDEAAKQAGIHDIVKQYGPVSRDHSFKRQRESQVLLVYGWEDSYELGVFPIKLFEYFAARRPILVTGGTPQEQFRSMLRETNAGKDCLSVEEIKQVLKEYYREYCETGDVHYYGIPAIMDKWSYREMAKKFASALNQITADKRSAP